MCLFVAILNKPIARDRHRILPVMTTTTLPVVLRRLRHDQRHFNRVTQTNQTIRQLSRSIKRLNLIPEMTQLTNRTRQSITAAHQSNVVPHDVLNGLHVALDQSRVRLISQTTLIPRRNIIKLRRLPDAVTQSSFNLERRSISPHESSKSEVDARRFAPCTPVQLISPTAYKLRIVERAHSSTSTPPQK